MQQLNVLISGFDHYDGVKVNPCLEVPRALASQGIDLGRISDEVSVQVNAVTIPVSFASSWPTLLEAIEATQPDIVIATGLKHAARSVLLERCATNLMDSARPDADNALPDRGPIDPDGPAAYWTRLPLSAILKHFAQDNVPAALSSDAGTFVCNSLFYNLLNWTARQKRVLSGFVSFPPIDDGAGLDQLIAASRDVVVETVRYHLRPSSADILLG